MCMTSIESFSQEVRGISTRRVIYNGPEYSDYDKYANGGYGGYKYSCKYYGWELTNHNSITVSVDVELYHKTDDGDSIEKTKSVILKSNESYILKCENISAYKVDGYNPWNTIDHYYVKYKAYKLE